MDIREKKSVEKQSEEKDPGKPVRRNGRRREKSFLNIY